jgi:hypothetical protein
MNRRDEPKITAALMEAIDQTLHQLGEQGVALPFLSAEISEIAAQAALAVLRAAHATEEGLRVDGQLIDA